MKSIGNYSMGSLISLNKEDINVYKSIGRQTINFVAYFKELIFSNIINIISQYSYPPK